MTLSLHDNEILRRRVRALVDDQLIAEHRERPFGPHSPSLIEVLDFLRRNPDPEMPRYLVLDDGSGAGLRVGLRAERPGEPPRPLDDERFATRGEAEHAVFLRRLADYGALRGALVANRATKAPQVTEDRAGRGDKPSLGDGNAPQGGGAE